MHGGWAGDPPGSSTVSALRASPVRGRRCSIGKREPDRSGDTRRVAHLPEYLILFALVGGESAGLFLPGETALIAAAALSARGRLDLPVVIAIAAAGAIVGDNLGYLAGRRGLRRFLRRRQALVARAEDFFARHGAPAVFFARWITGLRVVAAWVAGTGAMPWRRFLLWNALGGIAWAVSVGLLGYVLGRAATRVLGTIGIVVAVVVIAAALAVLAWRRRASSGA